MWRELNTAGRVLLVISLLLAFHLRVHDLGLQILHDDETHAVNAAALHDAAHLFTHTHIPGFGLDFGGPLALWNRLMIRTWGLGEWSLRLPVLLAGLASVGVGIRFAYVSLGAFSAALAAFLLATSPLLVLYSRYARPYALVAVLVLVATGAWWHWRRTGRRSSGVAQALAGGLAVFCNASAAPPVFALFAGAGIDAWRRDRAASLPIGAEHSARRAWTWISCLGAGVTLALLGPSLGSLLAYTAEKGAQEVPGAITLAQAGLAALGVSGFVPALLLGALTGWGFVHAWRMHPSLWTVIAVMGLASLGTIFALRPEGASHPIVVVRYAFATLPFALLACAHGIAQAIDRVRVSLLPERPDTAAALGCAAVAALPLLGPLPALQRPVNSYTNHLFHYVPPHWEVREERIPAFYSEIAAQPGTGAVMEVPWAVPWGFTFYHAYQRRHGRPVRTLTVRPGFIGQPGVAFQQIQRLRPDLDWRGVEFVVLHRDLIGELFEITERPLPDASSLARTRELHRRKARLFSAAFDDLPALEQIHEDLRIRVYRVRR